jgi:hypothetical protein
VYRELGDSRNGASLSEEAHCGGPRGRVSLLDTLGYERKALRTGISLHGDSDNLKWARLPGTLTAERGSGGGAFLSMGAL